MYISGLALIDVKDGALNNQGADPRKEAGNAVRIKSFFREGHPYAVLSGQALRAWLRNSLALDIRWQPSPITRDKKMAYTEGDGITYPDDDLFGYMVAVRNKDKKKGSEDTDEDDPEPRAAATTVSRRSPLRVSSAISLGPANIQEDLGVMARQEGSPVPYTSEKFHAVMATTWQLALSEVGRFTYIHRSGSQNLDDRGIARAQELGLDHDLARSAFSLPFEVRVARVAQLLTAWPSLDGGAKQAVAYTDVSPVVLMAAAVAHGGHPFTYAFYEGEDRQLHLDIDNLNRFIGDDPEAFGSSIYLGWRPGFARHLQPVIQDLKEMGGVPVIQGTCRAVMAALAGEVEQHREWFE